MSRRTVLIVAADAPLRSSVAAALELQGFTVITAGRYADGRRLLVERQPDVLVTTVRLQEHNGLHLAIVSRLSSVLTKTIVIGYGDPVLEADARQAGAVYLVDPTVDDVVVAVETSIHRRERRWPRARTNVTALAADLPVRLVDLSYGGFRMELDPGAELPTARGFELTIGTLRIPALPIWMKQPSGAPRVLCGASIAGNGERNPAWREFVDGHRSDAVVNSGC